MGEPAEALTDRRTTVDEIAAERERAGAERGRAAGDVTGERGADTTVRA